MKSYKKALVASLATVGVSCALIGGATFALFSSDSTTDIAVTSGKVNVTASIANVKAYSYQEIGDETPVEGFVNGGTAIYDKEINTLNINNITPGDWVEFDIVLTNNSTVDVKYRTSVNTADVNGKELFEALEFTAGDLSFVEGDANVKYTTWTKWEKDDEDKTITISSKVELPLTVEDNNNENELQAASCSISFKVEAVQGNASTTDPVEAIEVSTADDFAAAAKAGGYIKLTDNIDIYSAGYTKNGNPIELTEDNSTLDLNGHTLYASGNAIILSGDNVTVKNGTIDRAEKPDGSFTDYTYGLVVEGVNATIDNVTIYSGILVGNVNYGASATIKDCTIKIVCPGYGDHAVTAQHNSKVLIQGGTVTRDIPGLIGPVYNDHFWRRNDGSEMTVSGVTISSTDTNTKLYFESGGGYYGIAPEFINCTVNGQPYNG